MAGVYATLEMALRTHLLFTGLKPQDLWGLLQNNGGGGGWSAYTTGLTLGGSL